METVVARISEKTKVVLSVGTLVSLLGGGSWLTQMYFTSKATAITLREVKAKVELMEKEYNEKSFKNQAMIYRELKAINERLSRLEGRLTK